MFETIRTILKNPKSLGIGLIVLSTIFLISLLFPTEKIFNDSFAQGEVWDGEEIKAKNDFFVWKTKSELAAEKESVKIDFRPIFYRVNDKSAYHRRWVNLLQSSKELMAAQDFAAMLKYLRSISDKEILRSADLTLEKKLYSKVKVESSGGDFELRGDDYITIETLVSDMDNLTKIVPGQDIYEMITVELNEEKSKSQLSGLIENIQTYKRKVNANDLIISNGAIIDAKTFETLNALKMSTEEGGFKRSIVFIGFLLLTCLIIGVYVLYLYFHYPEILRSTRRIGFIMLLILVLSFLVFSIDKNANMSSYMIPFCIVPILMKSFFSDRLALFTHIVVVLIASFLSVLDYEFTFLEILAGIVAVLVIEDTRSWNKFFISILSIMGAYFIGYLGLMLIKYQAQVPIDWSIFKWLTISGVLTLLAYPFIPLVAKVFGFVSSITLSELGDLNEPLLKELSINAPGTLQHSLQVANLSEAAAEAIGANSLLLKVGALYHDVGKLHNPMIFIENQHGMNPHDNMTNFESARAIIDHVVEGEKMAKKSGLPEPIVDLIKTHHGNTRVEYFYRNQKNDFPDKEFDESLFRYPGPKPKTREETILMIADSLEAASKSLKDPTGQDIDNLVDKIVAYKIKNDQLSESELSFQDLEKCLDVFKSMLRNINHVRVEYPEE